MLPIRDHFSLICSQYLSRTLERNNVKYRFLHRVAPYLLNDVLPTIIYGTTAQSLPIRFSNPYLPQLTTVSFRLVLRKYRRKKQTSLISIGLSLFQLRLSFCISLHTYHERIGLPFLWRGAPHLRLYFLLSLASHIPDCNRPIGTSGIPFWSPTSSWQSSF